MLPCVDNRFNGRGLIEKITGDIELVTKVLEDSCGFINAKYAELKLNMRVVQQLYTALVVDDKELYQI